MNSLAIPAQAMSFPESNMQARFRLLPPRVQREVLERALQWGVSKGLEDYHSGVHGLGQDAMTGAIQIAVERALKPLMPVLTKELLGVVKPAAQEAAQVVGPVIRKELADKLPTFALISGAAAAILSIIGMVAIGGYVVKSVKKAG